MWDHDQMETSRWHPAHGEATRIEKHAGFYHLKKELNDPEMECIVT